MVSLACKFLSFTLSLPDLHCLLDPACEYHCTSWHLRLNIQLTCTWILEKWMSSYFGSRFIVEYWVTMATNCGHLPLNIITGKSKYESWTDENHVSAPLPPLLHMHLTRVTSCMVVVPQTAWDTWHWLLSCSFSWRRRSQNWNTLLQLSSLPGELRSWDI